MSASLELGVSYEWVGTTVGGYFRAVSDEGLECLRTDRPAQSERVWCLKKCNQEVLVEKGYRAEIVETCLGEVCVAQ